MKREAKVTETLGTLFRRYSFVLVFLVIYLVYTAVSGGLTLGAVMNVLRHSTVIGTMALGMGIVCLTGEIDLSAGSMLALDAGLSVVVFNVTNSIPLTLLFAVAFGAVLGLANGLLVGLVEMPAFIVTLATMLIYRSLSQYVCQHLPADLIGNGSSVYRMSSDLSAYQPLYAFGNGKLGAVPLVGIVMLAFTLLFVYLTTSTKFGKKIYAVGSNERAAWLAGINSRLMKTTVFGIAGALTGLAAFLWIAMNGSADPATTGKSYEMYAIAAVVLGGIGMSGGHGRVAGVLFGAMSYTVIDKIIIALKMDSLINDTIKGVILIAVIFVQMAGPKLRERFGRRKPAATLGEGEGEAEPTPAATTGEDEGNGGV